MFKFQSKFSLIIISLFILFTIIGTLLHELGHAVVAKYLDYDVTIHYGSTEYHYKGINDDIDMKKVNSILENYSEEDYEEWPDEIRKKVEDISLVLNKKYPYNKSHDLWITVGGPAQTILTCMIGLLMLYSRRKKRVDGLKYIDWLAVFLSLFILREIFNFVNIFLKKITDEGFYISVDEFRISSLLGYNEWIIPIIVLVLGVFISLYIILKVIPKKYQFSFMISGLLGGLLGYGIWFGFLGEILFN